MAMTVGWLMPVLGLVVGQLATSGRTNDVAATALWTGVFVLAGWVVAVLPLSPFLGRWRVLSSVTWAWLGWGLLGMAVYCLLAVPLAGWQMCIILWYPAIVGALAGLTFSLVVRS